MKSISLEKIDARGWESTSPVVDSYRISGSIDLDYKDGVVTLEEPYGVNDILSTILGDLLESPAIELITTPKPSIKVLFSIAVMPIKDAFVQGSPVALWLDKLGLGKDISSKQAIFITYSRSSFRYFVPSKAYSAEAYPKLRRSSIFLPDGIRDAIVDNYGIIDLCKLLVKIGVGRFNGIDPSKTVASEIFNVAFELKNFFSATQTVLDQKSHQSNIGYAVFELDDKVDTDIWKPCKFEFHPAVTNLFLSGMIKAFAPFILSNQPNWDDHSPVDILVDYQGMLNDAFQPYPTFYFADGRSLKYKGSEI